MRIWIDGYEANVAQRLGSSQVAFELIKALEKIDKTNEFTILLPNSPRMDFPKEREGFRYKILRPKRFWTRIALPLALFAAREKPDIFFSPTHYIPRFSKVKTIVTIFDLSFLHFPEMFTQKDLWQLKNGTKYSVENSDYIVTISNFTKKDIVSQYGTLKKKIIVAYPGYDKDKFSSKGLSSGEKIEEIKKKYKVGDSYIIYIGTIQPRKNLIRLIEAMASIEGLNLAIVGKSKGIGRQGWMYEDILQAPKKLGIEEKIIFTGFVPTDDLVYLLSGAVAYINPSLYEGFGIPVLEAMASGTPVIVSNKSSLQEIVGKAGLLVNPYSVNQIEQAIRTIANDKKFRQKYSKMGIIHSKKFSWSKMAKIVLRLFESV